MKYSKRKLGKLYGIRFDFSKGYEMGSLPFWMESMMEDILPKKRIAIRKAAISALEEAVRRDEFNYYSNKRLGDLRGRFSSYDDVSFKIFFDITGVIYRSPSGQVKEITYKEWWKRGKPKQIKF